MPAGQLARFRKYRRRAERKGPLRLRSGEDDQELDEVFRLHAARWESKGLTGMPHAAQHSSLSPSRFCGSSVRPRVPTQPRFLAFEFTASSSAKSPSGRSMAFGRAEFSIAICKGLTPQFAELCPGLLLVGEVLERARQEGARTVDFLRGDEPYKLMWGATGMANVRLRIGLARRG